MDGHGGLGMRGGGALGIPRLLSVSTFLSLAVRNCCVSEPAYHLLKSLNSAQQARGLLRWSPALADAMGGTFLAEDLSSLRLSLFRSTR